MQGLLCLQPAGHRNAQRVAQGQTTSSRLSHDPLSAYRLVRHPNDDIVRADSLVVDYVHRIQKELEEAGETFWLIEGIPKENAAVVWGKILFKIRQRNCVADRVEYYDEDGMLVKQFQTYDIREIDGAEVATRITMSDVSRPGYRTSITYDKLSFHPKIKRDTFTLRNLRR